ncbi:MAG: urea transporter [Gammaproteobacteria bacterium]|nr:urea transporter [Gammaproteobacteria bacterium]
MINFFKSTMSGIAQVIVQPCSLSGLIILASIAIHSWKMALGAFFGAVIGTASAKFLNFDSKDITLGIFGYNATLIGIANIYFFETSITSLIVFTLSCVLSVFITKWIPRYLKLPAFTAPFVFITWFIILIADFINLKPSNNILNFANNIHTEGLGEAVGQVYIQGNGITGVIMLVAILICSKSSFVWALVATTLTWLLAQSLNYPDTNIQNGLYGFSAVLTAIALQSMKPIIFPLIGIVLTVFVTQAFIISGWPSLTAPFVFVSWLITIIHFGYVKYSNQSTTLD